MSNWNYVKNQRGLTLIELLLSIVLLFIVLVTFMGFFSQTALFQKSNEEKLSVQQTSQKVVSLIELKVDLELLNTSFFNPTYQLTENGKTIYRISNKTDKNTIDVYKSDLSALLKTEIDSPYEITVDFYPFYQDTSSSLIQATIKVLNPSKIKSESITYTFIKG